jgi:hypothetical protein
MLVPPVQLCTWLTLTCPTLTAVAPANTAESMLALAESVPAAFWVEALGSVTVAPLVDWLPTTCWLWVAHGLAEGLATTGSEATPCGPEALAALARQAVLAP